MGLCTVQAMAISKCPNNYGLSAVATPFHSPLLSKPLISLSQIPITRTAALLTRSIFLRNQLPRATTSEETSSGASSKFVGEKRDGAIIVEDVKDEDNNVFNKTVATEDTKEELPVDEQALSFDLLDKLNLDTNDAGSIVLYGGGAIVALWLTLAVIGAIDSVPLFPKLLEVVGLAYTLWFSSRFLLFKKNRDELASKIDELKEQILGSEDN